MSHQVWGLRGREVGQKTVVLERFLGSWVGVMH